MPLTPSRSPLVDRVDADVARTALGFRRLAQADGDRRRVRLRPRGALGAVVADARSCRRAHRRSPRGARTAPRPTTRIGAAGPRAWQPGHLPLGLVDVRQQPDVRRRVLTRERPAAAAATVPDRTGLPPLLHGGWRSRLGTRPFGTTGPSPSTCTIHPGNRGFSIPSRSAGGSSLPAMASKDAPVKRLGILRRPSMESVACQPRRCGRRDRARAS